MDQRNKPRLAELKLSRLRAINGGTEKSQKSKPLRIWTPANADQKTFDPFRSWRDPKRTAVRQIKRSPLCPKLHDAGPMAWRGVALR